MSNPKTTFFQFLPSLPDTLSGEALKQVSEAYFKTTVAQAPDAGKPWRSPFGIAVVIISVVGCFITVGVMTNWFHLRKQEAVSVFDIVVYCAWTFLTPLWFLYEYVKIFPVRHKFNSYQSADMKYVMELASKVWAAVIVLITVILFLNTVKHFLSRQVLHAR